MTRIGVEDFGHPYSFLRRSKQILVDDPLPTWRAKRHSAFHPGLWNAGRAESTESLLVHSEIPQLPYWTGLGMAIGRVELLHYVSTRLIDDNNLLIKLRRGEKRIGQDCLQSDVLGVKRDEWIRRPKIQESRSRFKQNKEYVPETGIYCKDIINTL
jgi:hypothetical protein